MSNILIGLPIYKREWILKYWIDAIEKQDFPQENLGFLFNLGPEDQATHDILWEWQARSPHFKVFDAQIITDVHHRAHEDQTRAWNATRYETMVFLRNDLLDRATALEDQFDFYFSLDSDLLLEDKSTLSKLVSYAQEDPSRSVLSPLSYMTPYDTDFPSAMTWIDRPGGRAFRNHSLYQVNSLFKADVTMAAVFMQKDIFTKIRYRWHAQGEDLGFATNLAKENKDAYAAWDIYLPHMMHRSMLYDYVRSGHDGRKTPTFI